MFYAICLLNYRITVLCADGKILVRINLLFYFHFPLSFHITVVCFCPLGLSLLIQHFQQVLWVLKTEVTSTPTRPVENVLTMKGLQDRNIQTVRWKYGGKIKVKQYINSNVIATITLLLSLLTFFLMTSMYCF